MQIRLGISEDFALERAGLIALLQNYNNIEIVLSVGSGKELLDGVKKTLPDILLFSIDLQLSDSRKAFDRIKAKYPDLKVIILTKSFSDCYVVEYIQNGASAFLSKNTRIEKVVETIIKVNVYGKSYDNIVVNILARAKPFSSPIVPLLTTKEFSGLTRRQIEVVRLMCLGKENKEISILLGIEVRTIETHRRNIWAKAHCKNVIQLIEFAYKNNLISI